MQAQNKVSQKQTLERKKKTDLQLMSKTNISMCIKYKNSWQKMKTLTTYIQKSKLSSIQLTAIK